MNERLETRLRKLEWRNRVTAWIVVVLASMFLLGSRPATHDTTPLRAQRIELVDAHDTVRAVLGIDEDGAAGLFIHDPDGKLRLSLTHDESQSALFIRDAAETVRVGVAQFAHGGGGFALHGEGSKGAAVLYHKAAGSLSFYDREGKVTARIPADKGEE